MTAVSLPAPTSRHVANIDSDALAAALRAEVRGEARFDIATKALYATEASNYRQVPIGVIPRDLHESSPPSRCAIESERRCCPVAAAPASAASAPIPQ
jgi:hypothetical protein